MKSIVSLSATLQFSIINCDYLPFVVEYIHASKISTNAMAKLGKNEDVRLGILVNICKTLDCKLDDIVDILD